jgi:hypothetical protein
MIIDKIIEDDISLTTAELTSGDINSVIEAKIRNKYEGKCWDNVYVIKFKKIIKRNAIRMSVDRIDGSGNTNAQFIVEANEFVPGDVIVGCSIVDIIKDSKIICERDDAVITLKDQFFISPKQNQTLFIRVENASYLANHTKASVYGAPYVIDTRIIIQIPASENYTEDQKKMIAHALGRVANEQERVSNCGAELVKFFEGVLYPYKGGNPRDTPKKTTPAGSTLIDMFAMAKDIVSGKIKKVTGPGGSGALMSHPAVNSSTMKAYQLPAAWTEKLKDTAVKGSDTYVIDKTQFDIIMKILYEHALYLHTIADLCIAYKDASIRKKHDNIWDSYDRIKISI